MEEASGEQEAGQGNGGDGNGDRKPAAVETVGADSPDAAGARASRKRKGKADKSNHQMRWEEMYSRLLEYYNRFGNANVPNRYADDPQLGSWVSAQRRSYKTITSGATGSTAMTLDRATKLEKLGFEWEALNPNNVPWETRYKELLSFVKKYGHANVPMRWKENVQLSNWVSKQRHDYKLLQRGTSTRLNEERLKLLNDVGFIWTVERGSSIAQLQRVSVVGLPTRKSKKNDPEGTATQSPVAMVAGVGAVSTGSSSLAAGNRSSTAAADASNIGQTLVSSSSLSQQQSLSQAPANLPHAIITQRQIGAGGGGAVRVNGTIGGNINLGHLQALQLAQGALRGTLANQNPSAAPNPASPFLGLNIPGFNNAALATAATANAGQPAQPPMYILPILAMIPPQRQNQGTAAPASLGGAQVLRLNFPQQGQSNGGNANAVSALASLLGGTAAAAPQAAVSYPLNPANLAALLGGNNGNTAVPPAAGAPAVGQFPSPASSAGHLPASLAALASALGTPTAVSPASSLTTASVLGNGGSLGNGNPPGNGNPVPPQAPVNLASLTALLSGNHPGATPGQQHLTASTLAAALTGTANNNNVPASLSAAFPSPAPPNDVAGALASALSQFFEPPKPQAPPPPTQPTAPSRQNLAATLSQFFQNNPQTNPQTRTTTATTTSRNSQEEPEQQASESRSTAGEEEPPEKRAKTS